MESIKITSPDSNLSCVISLADRDGLKSVPVYELSYKGSIVLKESPLYFQLTNGRTEGLCVCDVEFGSEDEVWETSFGEDHFVRNNYNESKISFSSAENTKELEMDIVFRMYNEGLAFRYIIKNVYGAKRAEVLRECSHFCFTSDYYCFAGYTAQCLYEKTKLSCLKDLCDRPTVVELAPGGPYAAIGEAALTDFARMKLSYKQDNTLVSALSGKPLYFFKEEAVLKDADEDKIIKATAELPLQTPWRVIEFAEDSAALYRGRYIFQNLNPPCAIENTEFIKPGKVIRESTLTTIGAEACVDFAVRRNLQYIEFDAGWYGSEHDFESDATRVSIDPNRRRGELDMEKAIAYAAEKGIKVILYINQRAMMNQIDQLLPLYKKWGVAGIKYGFVEVGSQRWTAWLHECIRKAADYGLVLTIHDEYRPTGNHRTYPNLLNCEGIFGDEEKQPATNSLTHIFSRLLCGPADNTVCYFDERVDVYWSHAYQLAKAVCIFSPLQFLYWYDRPFGSLNTEALEQCLEAKEFDKIRNIISDEPELAFFDALPTVWDETLVLEGEIGKYAVFARRKAEEWFVGVMNGDIEREITVDCGFLDAGASYTAFVFSDNAALNTRTNVEASVLQLSNGDVYGRPVLPSNGFAMRIVRD